jgi:hypothetical protein
LRWKVTLLRPEEMLMVKEDLLLFIETSNDSIFQFKNGVHRDKDDKMIVVMSELWTNFEVSICIFI